MTWAGATCRAPPRLIRRLGGLGHGWAKLGSTGGPGWYDAIVRIFVLPKSNTPHTLIVISLDPPIRKGQTHYPHILIQFPSDEETTTELEISDEVFEAKNQAVSL